MPHVNDILAETTFDKLKSENEAKLLNVIDELRSQNVGSLLKEEGLPQLIVCGDQSSGKSSVLEGLTRVRFPAKSNVCTTFATELRLRREPTPRMYSRIIPGPSRSVTTHEPLARFDGTFDSPDKFPELVTAARECMSQNAVGSPTFFDDILQVEIAGPDLAPLTIVDLPGLFHWAGNAKGSHDVDLVTSLVTGYMKQKNSIILAVISANNDINNQVVLKHINKIVPDGNRTLGIITKPDTLPRGSEKEQEYLDLARNAQNNFQYGWHVVRNRTYEEQTVSNAERDDKEKEFFANSPWSSLPSREVGYGIESLRTKLGKMLLDHICLTLGSITQQLADDLTKTDLDLKRLGDPRETQRDHLNYLSDLGDKFSEYTKEALDGRYRKPFFGDPLTTDNLQKRLRATVRNLNDEFASTMLERGHKWHVVPDSEAPKAPLAPSPEMPIVIGKSQFLQEHVDTLAHHERGNELPGVANPLLIGSLFRQQSERWEELASAHVDAVVYAVKDFLEILLTHLADERTCNQVLLHILDPAMENRLELVKEKLNELVRPFREYDPIDLDPQFPRKIWALREKKVAHSVLESIRQELGDNGNADDLPTLEEIMEDIEASHIDDKYGSNETHEYMEAYYDSALLNFVNNVAYLAVEQCVLSDLPKVFCNSTVRDLDDEKLRFIAAESPDIISERARLQKRRDILKNGMKTIRAVIPQSMRKNKAPVKPATSKAEVPIAPITNGGKVPAAATPVKASQPQRTASQTNGSPASELPATQGSATSQSASTVKPLFPSAPGPSALNSPAGTPSTPNLFAGTGRSTPNLFAAAATTQPTSSLFSGAATTQPTSNLFGGTFRLSQTNTPGGTTSTSLFPPAGTAPSNTNTNTNGFNGYGMYTSYLPTFVTGTLLEPPTELYTQHGEYQCMLGYTDEGMPDISFEEVRVLDYKHGNRVASDVTVTAANG